MAKGRRAAAIDTTQKTIAEAIVETISRGAITLGAITLIPLALTTDRALKNDPLETPTPLSEETSAT